MNNRKNSIVLVLIFALKKGFTLKRRQRRCLWLDRNRSNIQCNRKENTAHDSENQLWWQDCGGVVVYVISICIHVSYHIVSSSFAKKSLGTNFLKWRIFHSGKRANKGKNAIHYGGASGISINKTLHTYVKTEYISVACAQTKLN